MIGIVVVSHSRALATAALALAREMAQAPVRIEIAAGLDEDTFGTDAAAIAEAIGAADTGDGVLVLMDVGSAVLSADLALELLDDEVRAGVRLSAAPLVEGLLVAAVAAAAGGAADQVLAEAANALAGKRAQLGTDAAHDGETAGQASTPTTTPRPRPHQAPASGRVGSRSSTGTGCTPGPPHAWFRRFAASTPRSRSATSPRDPAQTVVLVLALGSATSHAAILARARGIPAVVGVGPAVLQIPTGTEVAVDGSVGEVDVEPEDTRRAELVRRGRGGSLARRGAADGRRPAVTRDKTTILVAANIGSIVEARAAVASGADLAGLVRTEFLFLDREQAPGVEEQLTTYLALAEAMGGHRLTLRTLDVDGDKPLPYVPVPRGDNPFLGVRGLSLSLSRPGLLRDQLRAIVRTARHAPVSLMFPMVTAVAELLEARRLLDEVLASEAGGPPTGFEVGMMVEVPAVANKIAAFAPHVDFFSIGTNDLTQYALAAERGNAAVGGLGDAYDPGVLALIRAVCAAAAGGPRVGVCGELAGEPQAAALLVGLGVRELSVVAYAIPAVKQAVRAVDIRDAEHLAAAALTMPGPAEVPPPPRSALMPCAGMSAGSSRG